MSLVAILGAGEIGGATARALATRGRVNVVRIIDEAPNVGAGKALDLSQALPVIGSDTKLQWSNEYSAAAGANAIVLADDATDPGGEWAGDVGLSRLRRLSEMGCFHQSVIIFAGAAQRVLMQQALDELGVDRRRTIGSAPEALAASVRALVAIEAKSSAAQVMLAVMGQLPDRVVIPWVEGSIGGSSVTSLLTASQLHRLEARLRGLWPPGTTALGTAAALAAEAVAAGSRRIFSAYVALDRDNGTKAPVCAWPVSIGPAGLERVARPSLTGRDRVIMDGVLE